MLPRRSDEAPAEGESVLTRMPVALELGLAEQEGSGRAARSRQTRERVGPDLKCVDDFPVDILEVALRLAGVPVDVEGDKEGAECRPLIAGVDLGARSFAAIRERGRKATRLVPHAVPAEARDEGKGSAGTSRGDAERVGVGTRRING